MVHRGEIVEKIVRQSNVPIVKVAKLMGKNPKTLYNWFGEENLNLQKILDIGKVIHHDFSEQFKELKDLPNQLMIVAENVEPYGKEENFKEKYYRLLEEQNALLREGKAAYEGVVSAVMSLARAVNTNTEIMGTGLNKGTKDVNESLLQIARMLDR